MSQYDVCYVMADVNEKQVFHPQLIMNGELAVQFYCFWMVTEECATCPTRYASASVI